MLLTEGYSAATHKGVVTLSGLLFVKTGKFDKQIGKYLANLKEDRENVDYEVFSYVDEETARTAMNEAREFLNETKRYLREAGMLQ